MSIQVDKQQLSQDLAKIVSRPAYRQMLAAKLELMALRDKRVQPVHALRFAEGSVNYAVGGEDAPKLQYPVEVTELVPERYPILLYRVYDGIDRAGTLGSWWGSRKLLKVCVASSSKGIDHPATIQNMLGRMFVHPHFNRGTDIARMSIPVGARTPVITGMGDWKAMLKASDPMLGPGAHDPLKIETEEDVRNKLGMDTTLESRQYFLPFVMDGWVAKVPHLSSDWPFK